MAPRHCVLRFATVAAPFVLLCQTASVHQASSSQPNDRTVTQVVKLLQGMMDQSKADGDTERNLYAKYKCYVVTNEASKTGEIEELTKLIGLLENKIEELLASNGELSKRLQVLLREIDAVKKALREAKALRLQENAEYVAQSGDFSDAIEQMRNAINVLSEVNADQTGGDDWETRTVTDRTSQDHKQNMAGYTPSAKGASLSALKTTVRKALVAASAMAGQRQTSTIEAFLQSPFTGTYSAQSGEVVGILKDMRDTFKANLAAATSAEGKAKKAYERFKGIMDKKQYELEEEKDQKAKLLATNEDELGSKRDQLELAREDLGNAQTFLSALLILYDAKTKQYNERVALRRKEETALAEAMSILNSDAAFATFGTVDATRSGATQLVQLQAIRSHGALATDRSRKKVQSFLQRTADKQHSPMLGRIVALLRSKNPFAVVLTEIDKMIELLAAEEKADAEQQQWCNQERTDTDSAISAKSGELDSLESAIHTLGTDINDPEEGLLAQLTQTETSIQENHDSQVSQTEQRRQENDAYQKDVRNLVSAEALLKRAIVVLRNYYSAVSSEISPALLQKESPTKPAPPETWDDKYAGQSSGAGSVVDMLEFIVKNTHAEETTAHNDELEAQHSYEDEMLSLKDEMENLQTTLGTVQATLARKQQELRTKEKEHAATSREKAALETYLEKIKPGCDFITTNLEKRKANRVEETSALNEAKRQLKASPAHAEAEARAHQDRLGECAPTCNRLGDDHAECKACLAKVAVPGYCAGHPDTEGC